MARLILPKIFYIFRFKFLKEQHSWITTELYTLLDHRSPATFTHNFCIVVQCPLCLLTCCFIPHLFPLLLPVRLRLGYNVAKLYRDSPEKA